MEKEKEQGKEIKMEQAMEKARKTLSRFGFTEKTEEDIVQFIRTRFEAMESSKRETNAKFSRCRELRETSLRVYQARNVYNIPYRSAQFHQNVESRIDEITENFPNASLRASTYRDKNAGERARGKERVLKSMDEEIGIEAKREALAEDIAVCGMGIFFEDVKKERGTDRYVIDSLVVNPRDLYWDEAAVDFDQCRDFLWQREIPYSTFLALYSDRFDAEKIPPARLGKDGLEIVNADQYRTERETEDKKKETKYIVRVNDYFNDEEGFRIVVANQKILWAEVCSPRFSAYYNKKMNDSVAGVGIIEEIAPEVFALDTITQLAFLNAKNQLQSMIIAAPETGLHSGLKLQPGGIFTLTGLTDTGRVSDAFAEITLGKIPNDFFNLRTMFLDNLSISSQKDQRALLENPNQLATQTNAKKESFAKRGRRLQRGIMWRSEKRRWENRLRLLDEYIVPRNQEYFIDGYFVLRGDTENPRFVKDSSANGIFRMTPKNSLCEAKVIVSSAKNKAVMNEEEKNQLLQLFGMTMNARASDPEFAESVDLKAIHRALVERMELDPKDVYRDYNSTGFDAVEAGIRRARMGMMPRFPKTRVVEDIAEQVMAYRIFLAKENEDKDAKQIIIRYVTKIMEKMYEIAESEAQDPDDMVDPTPPQEVQTDEAFLQKNMGAVPNMSARMSKTLPVSLGK